MIYFDSVWLLSYLSPALKSKTEAGPGKGIQILNTPNSENADLSTLRINREDNKEPVRAGRYFRLLLWVAIPVVAVIILWLVLSRISPAIEVRISTAAELTRSQAQAVLSATGYVVAQRKAAVASKATGRLEYIGVEEGDAVVKDQVIARIENEDMQAALELATANLAQAKAESIEAHLDYARKKDMWVNEIEVSQMVHKADTRRLTKINWVKEPEYDHLQKICQVIAKDIIVGEKNSLAGNFLKVYTS